MTSCVRVTLSLATAIAPTARSTRMSRLVCDRTTPTSASLRWRLVDRWRKIPGVPLTASRPGYVELESHVEVAVVDSSGCQPSDGLKGANRLDEPVVATGRVGRVAGDLGVRDFREMVE